MYEVNGNIVFIMDMKLAGYLMMKNCPLLGIETFRNEDGKKRSKYLFRHSSELFVHIDKYIGMKGKVLKDKNRQFRNQQEDNEQ